MIETARRTGSGVPFVFAIAFWAALILGAAYLFLPLLAVPVWLIVAVKGAVCPLLAIAVWSARGGDADAMRLGLALLFSAAGDVFLALDRDGLFVQGLSSFLLAHLVYLWQFLRRRSRLSDLPFSRKWVVGGIVALVLIMLVVLTPHLGALLVPVYAYMAAIAAMALAATLLPGRALVMLGALSFLLSDSLIALDKFIAKIPVVGPVIWLTYLLAQSLIVLGWRNHRSSFAESSS